MENNRLTELEIKELKKTICIKLSTEKEVNKAVKLLRKYNQHLHPNFLFNGHNQYGILNTQNPQSFFRLHANVPDSSELDNYHKRWFTRYKETHGFVLDNLELLEYLFQREENLMPF